jgi:hypothetical protein
MPVLTFRYCFGHNKSYKVNFDAMLWFDFLVFLSLGFWLIKKVRKCWFLINLSYVFDLKKRKKKISFDRKKSWSCWKIAYKTTNCVHLCDLRNSTHTHTHTQREKNKRKKNQNHNLERIIREEIQNFWILHELGLNQNLSWKFLVILIDFLQI